MELSPQNHNTDGLLGPNSIMVVYFKGSLKGSYKGSYNGSFKGSFKGSFQGS